MKQKKLSFLRKPLLLLILGAGFLFSPTQANASESFTISWRGFFSRFTYRWKSDRKRPPRPPRKPKPPRPPRRLRPPRPPRRPRPIRHHRRTENIILPKSIVGHQSNLLIAATKEETYIKRS